jgi:hypothetical protein
MLLGAEDLLGRMLTSRRKLGDQHPDILIETVYACESSTNAPGVTWIRALTPNARSPMWRWPKARSAPSA